MRLGRIWSRNKENSPVLFSRCNKVVPGLGATNLLLLLLLLPVSEFLLTCDNYLTTF
jgi:hypothetical protein